MYTIKQSSISKVRIFNKMGLSESFTPSTVSENNEIEKDANIINTFRGLFTNKEFVTRVQNKIATLPKDEQTGLNTALNNILSMNEKINGIHKKVRDQLDALLSTVETQTA